MAEGKLSQLVEEGGIIYALIEQVAEYEISEDNIVVRDGRQYLRVRKHSEKQEISLDEVIRRYEELWDEKAAIIEEITALTEKFEEEIEPLEEAVSQISTKLDIVAPFLETKGYEMKNREEE